jgi:hypothetical protein
MVSVFGSFPEIKTVQDILNVQDFVFQLIPWTETPFEDKMCLEENNPSRKSLQYVFDNCRSLKIGGWCGLNAEFMRLFLAHYGIKSSPYNYGLVGYQFTHVGLVVEIEGKKIFFDPYFNRVYRDKNGELIVFDELIMMVQHRQLQEITPVYGCGHKRVKTSLGYVMKSGEPFNEMVMEYFHSRDFNGTMLKVFGDKNPLLLFLIKVPEPPKA